MLYYFLPTVIMIGSMLVPFVVILWIRRLRMSRRSPLTVQLLRSPGEELSRQIDEINENIDTHFTFLSFTPLMCYSVYLSIRIWGDGTTSWLYFALTCVLLMAYLSWKLAAGINIRENLRLGLDCERAVGQELNQLMLDGYRVFHDFPADNFNIDHIVVGATGVFAVETKGRSKLVKGDVKIIYDGQGVHFPTHYEREPVEQAKRQADWLSRWLTSAVGAQVSTRPVLVYPGWFIERKKPGLLIYNGKNPQAVFKIRAGELLSAEMVQRISHQLEQRCRNVEGLAYKKRTIREILSNDKPETYKVKS